MTLHRNVNFCQNIDSKTINFHLLFVRRTDSKFSVTLKVYRILAKNMSVPGHPHSIRSKLKNLKFLHYFWSIVCVTGLSIQLYQICVKYFDYETTTTAILDVETEVDFPTTVLCTPYRYLKYPGLRRRNITVKQIFEKLPKSKKFASRIYYRKRGKWVSINGPENVSKSLKITRYLMNSDLCYSLSLKTEQSIKKEEMILAGGDIFTIFGCRIDLDFDRMYTLHVVPIVHYGFRYPYESRYYTQPILTSYSNRSRLMITTTNYKIETYSLPPPYKTMCVYVPAENGSLCSDSCVMHRLKNYSFVPFSVIFPEPGINKTLTGYEEPEFIEAYFSAREICNKNCLFNPCYHRYSVTFPALSHYRDHDKSFIYIEVRMPQSSSSVNQVIAVMSFTEFFSLASSCFGTWLGLSFMSTKILFDWLTQKRRGEKRRVSPENRMAVDHHHHIHHHNLHVRRPLFNSRSSNG